MSGLSIHGLTAGQILHNKKKQRNMTNPNDKEMEQLKYTDTIVDFANLALEYGVPTVMHDFTNAYPHVAQEISDTLAKEKTNKQTPALFKGK